MRTLLITAFLQIFGTLCMAQSYLGTYMQLPPHGMEKEPESLKMWAMSKLEIRITPAHVTFIWPNAKFQPAGEDPDTTYTVHGDFLLVAKKMDGEAMFTPIYIFDKDTIFAHGAKFVRVKNDSEKK